MTEEIQYRILFKLIGGRSVYGYACIGDLCHLYDQILHPEGIEGGAEFIEIPNVGFENPEKKNQIVHRSEILQITTYIFLPSDDEEENED